MDEGIALHQALLLKFKELKLWVEDYEHKHRSISCSQSRARVLEQEKQKTLKLLDQLTNSLHETEEKLVSARKNVDRCLQYCEDNKDKYEKNKILLEEQSAKLFEKAEKIIGKLNIEETDQNDRPS